MEKVTNYIYSLSLVYKTQMTFKASQSRNMFLRDRGGRRSLERVIILNQNNQIHNYYPATIRTI